MQTLKQRILPFCLMLSIPIITIIYQHLNNPLGVVHSLVTNLDEGIPFLKIFILPYLGFYLYVFLTLCYFCLKDRKTYYKTLVAINISYLFCFLIYYFFQTSVPRPYLYDQGLLSTLVSMVFRLDNPYNTFPSIHVLTSYLMIKAINRCSNRNKQNVVLVYCVSILIIISTMFVKQHVIFDAVSAILLGDLVFETVYYLSEVGGTIVKHPVFFNFGRGRA